MGASHLEHATLSPPLLARGPCLLTVYGRPPTKRVDTGPSCIVENTIVPHLILMCID